MKVSKKVAVAAASALVALGATSAMAAMEHQFSGSFKVQADVSNFNGSNTPNGDGVYEPFGKDKKAASANFVDSRARIGYTAKANNDLKFVSVFELDYSFWGNNSYSTHRNEGGALGADSVNIETKNLYLDVNLGTNTNTKLGMQGFTDAFKGIFVDADMAGGLLTHSYSNASATLGLFRWDDNTAGNADALGRRTRDFVVLDGKFKVAKETTVGAAYYFLRDRSDLLGLDSKIHTLGLNFETVAGALTLDGFVVGQFGDLDKNIDQSAFAANLGAKVKAGAGTLRAELLYASGDDGTDTTKSESFYTAYGKGGYENGFYNNEMVILGRDKNALTIDNAIVYDANNQGHGIIFASLGYDLPLNDKMDCSANLGMAWNDKTGTRNGDKNSNQFIGTEINAEYNYKFMPNLTFGARAAYVVLGDYFKDVAAGNSTPDNPYDLKLIAKYSF